MAESGDHTRLTMPMGQDFSHASLLLLAMQNDDSPAGLRSICSLGGLKIGSGFPVTGVWSPFPRAEGKSQYFPSVSDALLDGVLAG